MGIRRSVAILAVLFLALGGLALPTADAGVQPWDGTWTTTNQFGHPKLHLEQANGEVNGWYTNDAGARVGKIWGDLSERGKVWIGRYRADDKSDQGKFRVERASDLVSFDGWFKSCNGWFTCSKKYNWTGEHA